jgi:hypothetical protein
MGMHDKPEYHLAYAQAEQDPSCWQPIDPARTFAQYPQYGFGKGNRPQKLRVVEATEAYKLNNLRYKEFDRDQTIRRVMDKDDEKQCFGWAKYVHEYDREVVDPKLLDATNTEPKTFEPTAEWRPCFAMQPKADATPTAAAKAKAQPKASPVAKVPSYKVKLLQEVAKVSEEIRWPAQPVVEKRNKEYPENTYYLVPKPDVLLKPRTPMFDGLAAPEHLELLDQAELLRKYGNSDFQIAETLQKQLKERWDKKADKSEDDVPPPPITVDVVRSYMQQLDIKVAKEKEAEEQKAKAKKK